MRERLIPLLIAVLVGSGILLMLPPGPAARFSAAVRYVTRPVQSWGDLAARITRAAVRTDKADPPETSAASVEALAEKLAATQLEYQSAQASMEQMRWDLRLLGARQASYQHPFTVCVARVIQRDPLLSYHDTIVIDRGVTDGVKPGCYVVGLPKPGDDGTAAEPELMGKVTEVTATTSKVMLMSHPLFSAPCTIPSRGISGVLMSRRKELGLPYEWPSAEIYLAYPVGTEYKSVAPGDRVYTSGLGEDASGVANVLIGTVEEKTPRDDGMPAIQLKPAASMAHFSHVLVVLGSARK